MSSAGVPPLVEEATKKSGLVWLSVDGAPARPVWHLWHEGAAYVVTGGREQPAPDLGGRDVAVTVRSKDRGSRIVTWTAAVETVPPRGDLWRLVAPLLAAKRLNAADGAAMLERWAAECVLHRLAPTGDPREEPGSMPDGSLAAPPLPSPATSRTRRPFTLGRRRRRRAGGRDSNPRD
jgi:hypothetical protein